MIRSAPPGRTPEQLWHHFEVEAALAEQLRATTRQGRTELFREMYDLLFDQVPDHPRLSRRADPEATRLANGDKLSLLRGLVQPSTSFVELAPGDGHFCAFVAALADLAMALDISDQRSAETAAEWPSNASFVLFDGFTVPDGLGGMFDVAFSDQLLEHLHPDDVAEHLRLVRELLRADGTYVLRTPHAASGPWDISRYFMDEPRGFHLQEFNYRSLHGELRRAGFTRVVFLRRNGSRGLPFVPLAAFETVVARLPRRVRTWVADRALTSIACRASSGRRIRFHRSALTSSSRASNRTR